jgi:hypothetical protein
MLKKKKGGFRHPTNTGNKGIVYLSDLQIFGAETTDEENPHVGKMVGDGKACLTDALTISKRETYDEIGTPKSMLGKNLPAFQWNIIFSLQKESKTVRQLSEEFSIDPATIRETLRRLIRYGFVAEVWRGKDTRTNKEATYYSSDMETVRFCQLRKGVSNDRLY